MDFSLDELKLLKSCLIITQETIKCMPFKNKKCNDKIIAINDLLLKFKGVD